MVMCRRHAANDLLGIGTWRQVGVHYKAIAIVVFGFDGVNYLLFLLLELLFLLLDPFLDLDLGLLLGFLELLLEEALSLSSTVFCFLPLGLLLPFFLLFLLDLLEWLVPVELLELRLGLLDLLLPLDFFLEAPFLGPLLLFFELLDWADCIWLSWAWRG